MIVSNRYIERARERERERVRERQQRGGQGRKGRSETVVVKTFSIP